MSPPDSSAEPYPGFDADQKIRAEKQAAMDYAHAAILPGALRAAFAGEPVRTGDLVLQPVTLGLCALLERVKSPLLDVVRILREEFSASPSSSSDSFSRANTRIAALKFEEEQIAETIFIFTRPAKFIRKLLDSGRDKFREAAMESIGDKLHPAQTAALQCACAQHYVASFATIIGYGVAPPEGEVVFRAPSPSAATDSAGG